MHKHCCTLDAPSPSPLAPLLVVLSRPQLHILLEWGRAALLPGWPSVWLSDWHRPAHCCLRPAWAACRRLIAGVVVTGVVGAAAVAANTTAVVAVAAATEAAAAATGIDAAGAAAAAAICSTQLLLLQACYCAPAGGHCLRGGSAPGCARATQQSPGPWGH